MVKKLKAKVHENQVAQNIVDFARLVWLAGLGAYSKVEEEGGKLFESLVKEGEKFEAHTKKMADKKVEGVKDKVEEVKDKAIDTWDKLEENIEDRVAGILNRLGVPTNEDISDLSKRVETLNESVKKLLKTET